MSLSRSAFDQFFTDGRRVGASANGLQLVQTLFALGQGVLLDIHDQDTRHGNFLEAKQVRSTLYTMSLISTYHIRHQSHDDFN